MKNLYLCLFAFLAINALALSQDFRPLNPERAYSYTNGHNIQEIRIDSSKTIGNIKYYYFYKTWNTSDFGCVRPNGPTWLGYYYTEDAFGNSEFIRGADTFRIHTQALPGDEWVLYVHPDGDVLTANVEKIEVEEFLGIIDTVKTISIEHSTIVDIDFASPFTELKISKNNGCLNFPSLYPDNGDNYVIMGITNPDLGRPHITYYDIYNFEPGDEFHSTSSRLMDFMRLWRTIDRILEKTYSANQDTVIYKMEEIKETKYYDYSTEQTVIMIDTAIKYQHYLINPSSSLPLPGEALIDKESDDWLGISNDYPFSISKEHNNRRKYHPSYATIYFNPDKDTCWWENTLGEDDNYHYLEGCGLFTIDPFNWTDYVFQLVYYKKAGETWGTPIIISSVEEPEITDKDGIYPNPASDFIYLNNADLKLVEIITPEGVVAISTMVTDKIDISSLQPGLYFVRSGNNFYKFIKI